MLSGEGSDEVFGGYPIYKYMQALERYRAAAGGAAPAPDQSAARTVSAAKWRKYTELSEPAAREALLPACRSTRRPIKDALYRPEIRNRSTAAPCRASWRRYYEKTEGLDPLLRMMYLDVKSWLPDDLLIKADKMTMATSVELRVPFLDHRVVELGGRIPPRLRIKGWETKYILRRPWSRTCRTRSCYRGKMGFPTPLARMFQGDLSGYVERGPRQRPLPRPRLFPPGGGAAAGRRARGGGAGPPPRALAAPGAGGVAPEVHRLGGSPQTARCLRRRRHRSRSFAVGCGDRAPASAAAAVIRLPASSPSTASMWRASLSSVTSWRSVVALAP